MRFLAGDELDRAIRAITKEARARCAVAFWGRGAQALFPDLSHQKVEIICNLRAGGTNPYVIEALRDAGAEIKQCDALHAKVYLGENRAVVTSANASVNGLGLEGIEQARWAEAGVELDDVHSVAVWFDAQWGQSRLIKDSDIKAAKIRWRQRQKSKPSLISFADFDAEAEDLPLVSWWGDSDLEPHKESIESQLGRYDDELAERVENSVEIEHANDKPMLERLGTWILFWERAGDGLPSWRSNPYWFCTGSIVRKAFHSSNKRVQYDAVLPAEQPPPDPFDATDRLFQKALREVLKEDEYKEFRRDDYKEGCFAPRKKLMRLLWHDLKQRYLELAKSQ